MRFYEKRIFWLICISIIIFLIGVVYFYKEYITFSFELIIPLNSNDFLLFLGTLITLFSWLFWWLYRLDIQEEKDKHLWYIRTINDRIWKKIDWNFFTDIQKAKKFCEKEIYYIVPYWYRFNISSIDDEVISDAEYEETEYDKIRTKISKNFSLDTIYNELENVKEFIDLEYFIKRLDSKNINNFDIKEKWIVNENFFYFDKINDFKNTILNEIDKHNDFIIVEWYYYLYKI